MAPIQPAGTLQFPSPDKMRLGNGNEVSVLNNHSPRGTSYPSDRRLAPPNAAKLQESPLSGASRTARQSAVDQAGPWIASGPTDPKRMGEPGYKGLF